MVEEFYQQFNSMLPFLSRVHQCYLNSFFCAGVVCKKTLLLLTEQGYPNNV